MSRCNLLFKSANQLKEHRTKAKHLVKRKKKVTNEQPAKQLRLEDVIMRTKNTTDEAEGNKEDESDENEGMTEEETCAICEYSLIHPHLNLNIKTMLMQITTELDLIIHFIYKVTMLIQ